MEALEGSEVPISGGMRAERSKPWAGPPALASAKTAQRPEPSCQVSGATGGGAVLRRHAGTGASGAAGASAKAGAGHTHMFACTHVTGDFSPFLPVKGPVMVTGHR